MLVCCSSWLVLVWVVGNIVVVVVIVVMLLGYLNFVKFVN